MKKWFQFALLMVAGAATFSQQALQDQRRYEEKLTYHNWDNNRCTPLRLSRIQGSVQDDLFKEPIAGAGVAVFRESDHARVCLAMSGADGKFDCGPLRAGRYRVISEAPNHFRQNIPVKIVKGIDKPLSLDLPAKVGDVEMVCSSGKTVEEEMASRNHKGKKLSPPEP